jgi:hypothetical protein
MSGNGPAPTRCTHGYYPPKLCPYFQAESSFAAPPCSAPVWYTREELRHYLTAFQHYHKDIANELCDDYAKNLQRAFEKGWEMATRKAQNEKGQR